jgi:phenylacetate-CoA ligase
MKKFINLNNFFKPSSYWAYVDGIFELSKYVIENKIKLNSPNFIITTIGPLYKHNREIIEQAFACKTYNQYGSREMGAISIERENREMDIFFLRQAVELIGKEGEKNMIITSLDNYSMPFLRYQIGDVASETDNNYILGSVKFFLSTTAIIGRTLGFFKMKDGSLKHTHFLVQQLFFKDWIKKFQLIQKRYDQIVIKIIGLKNETEMKEIENMFMNFLGDNFTINWEFVDEIKPTKSGKYLYTISEIV